jgi:hypothetical protein
MTPMGCRLSGAAHFAEGPIAYGVFGFVTDRGSPAYLRNPS